MDFQTRVLRDPNSHDGLAGNHHHHSHHHHNYDSYARFSSAMAIPGPAPSFERTVPPPLPPPRMPLTDPSNSGGGACHCYRGGSGGGSLGHSHGAADPSSDYGSVVAGSFGSDGAHPDFRRRDPSAYARRGDGSSGTGRDEGYASFSSSRSSRDSVPAQQFLGHSRFEFVSYGDSLKDKLNASRTLDIGSNKAASLSASQPPPPPPPPPPRSALSASLNVDTRTTYPPRPAPDRYSDRYPNPLCLPSRPRPLLEESDRFTQTPIRSGLSPGGHGGAPSLSPYHHLERRATNDSILATELDRASPRRPRRADSSSFFPDDVTESTQASAEDDDMEVGHLRLDDSFRSGQKRRASSPAGDDIAQGYPSRGSPTPRLSAIIHPTAGSTTSAMMTTSSSSSSSAAAVAAAAGRWSNHSPYASSSLSNIGLAAAAAAAIAAVGSGDFARRSSVPYSTDGASVSPLGTEASPFTSPPPSSVDPSPRGSISRACTVYARPYGEPRPSALPSPRRVMVVKAAGATVQDFYMCECCPKKPKKFDTMDQLSSHMSEKQYECTFCGNRFKNKNEAERHQNSLHVRSHSWSCSALSSYDRAFHESTARPGLADTCGYCGIDFDRRGEVVLTGGGGCGGTSPTISKSGRAISERDWEERVRHLQEIHKFRECNSGKKFYRADHFRQHLKHSHAGSSGKWTNMLENACMIEERYDKADGGRPSVSSCRETWDP